MNNELFEKIEYLRANADIGYEEAASLLASCDGDLTRALIELERSNRTYAGAHGKANSWDNVFARGVEYKDDCKYRGHHHHHHHHNPNNWFRKLMRAKVQFSKDGKQVAELPVVAPIAAAIFFPHVTIIGAVAGYVCGFRIKEFEKERSSEGGEEA